MRGRLSTRTHASAIVETMGYNGNGYLATISAGGSTRYTVTGMNARQQLTGSTYGSTTPVTATYGYDAYGYPLSQDAKAGAVYKQDYRYVFSPLTGNLTSRQNYLQSKSESFTYDTTLDRLLTITGPQNLTMSYNTNGNINTRSDIGTVAFSYGASAGPYALTVANSLTNNVSEYSFDAWGRRRNPTDWSYTLTSQPALFADRGFTSHEFLSWFNLYNMNGRMYDPLVGRFLSAVNYVQDPSNSQSYNRYSYGLNNPLC